MNISTYFSGAVSTANTIVQQNKGALKPSEVANKVLLAVYQDIVNAGEEAIFKAVSLLNPAYKPMTEQNFNIRDMAVMFAGQEVTKYAMEKLHKLDEVVELPLLAEDAWAQNDYTPVSRKKVKVSNTDVQGKTEAEMLAESAGEGDCAGGGCKI